MRSVCVRRPLGACGGVVADDVRGTRWRERARASFRLAPRFILYGCFGGAVLGALSALAVWLILWFTVPELEGSRGSAREFVLGVVGYPLYGAWIGLFVGGFIAILTTLVLASVWTRTDLDVLVPRVVFTLLGVFHCALWALLFMIVADAAPAIWVTALWVTALLLLGMGSVVLGRRLTRRALARAFPGALPGGAGSPT